jgi:hypothetical protein
MMNLKNEREAGNKRKEKRVENKDGWVTDDQTQDSEL